MFLQSTFVNTVLWKNGIISHTRKVATTISYSHISSQNQNIAAGGDPTETVVKASFDKWESCGPKRSSHLPKVSLVADPGLESTCFYVQVSMFSRTHLCLSSVLYCSFPNTLPPLLTRWLHLTPCHLEPMVDSNPQPSEHQCHSLRWLPQAQSRKDLASAVCCPAADIPLPCISPPHRHVHQLSQLLSNPRPPDSCSRLPCLLPQFQGQQLRSPWCP